MQKSVTETSRSLSSGFTQTDLAALNYLRADGLVQQRWSKAEIVQARYVDYLAAWDMDADGAAAPTLAIARFKRTGTYALMISSLVVGTAASLDKILPAIRQAFAGSECEAVATI